MKLLIIEDEEPAAERLKKLVNSIVPDAEILDTIVSVKSAVRWLQSNPAPDLILLDIHLADGSSFEIFSQVDITTPVIFTTAYDEYAVRAFKVNSVDYLLKPIRKEELKSALDKFEKYHATEKSIPDISELIASMKEKKPAFKKRFLIRFGEHLKSVDISDVAYFYTEEKINFMKTRDNHTYHVDYNLDKLEEILDPERFFRINRQFIISIDCIDQMYAYSKSRVKITLKPQINLETIVSTERSPLFKEWLSAGD